MKRNNKSQSNESSNNIRSNGYANVCVVAAPAERAHTNATWRMQHALQVVGFDGLAARRVITVAFGAFVASRRRPVVVEEVTDVDKAASHSSAVLVTVASR